MGGEAAEDALARQRMGAPRPMRNEVSREGRCKEGEHEANVRGDAEGFGPM